MPENADPLFFSLDPPGRVCPDPELFRGLEPPSIPCDHSPLTFEKWVVSPLCTFLRVALGNYEDMIPVVE